MSFVAVLTATESEMFRMWMDARQCEEIPLSKLCSITDLKAARNCANSVLPKTPRRSPGLSLGLIAKHAFLDLEARQRI
jgi:hypothetical protein